MVIRSVSESGHGAQGREVVHEHAKASMEIRGTRLP